MLKIIAKPPSAYHSRMKHLSIKEGFIYDNVKSGQVKIIYVPTTDNLADFLTKAVPAIKLCGNKIKHLAEPIVPTAGVCGSPVVTLID